MKRENYLWFGRVLLTYSFNGGHHVWEIVEGKVNEYSTLVALEETEIEDLTQVSGIDLVQRHPQARDDGIVDPFKLTRLKLGVIAVNYVHLMLNNTKVQSMCDAFLAPHYEDLVRSTVEEATRRADRRKRKEVVDALC